jgi:hypothetical protein
MNTTRQAYINAVVTHFVRLPGTPLRPSRRDRQLAARLYDRNVPLRVVWAAFVIAAARWALRGPQQGRLETIRTLYYFLPVVEEVLATTPEQGYVPYLAAKLRPAIAEKEQRLAEQLNATGRHR